jgi:hypothetical protein
MLFPWYNYFMEPKMSPHSNPKLSQFEQYSYGDYKTWPQEGVVESTVLEGLTLELADLFKDME